MALQKTWELGRKAADSALQSVIATIRKEDKIAVATMAAYEEARYPSVATENESWDLHAKEFMRKKGWV